MKSASTGHEAVNHNEPLVQLPVRLRSPERTLRVACRAAAVSGRRVGARAGLVLLLPVGSVQRVLDVPEFVASIGSGPG
jgi:hypothetical protein